MTIGIIGFGAFGSLIHELCIRLAPTMRVLVFSPDKKIDQVLFVSLEEVCTADILFLAVPIRSFEEVLVQILPFISESTVLVDISTVKMHTNGLLRRLAHDRRFVSAHPMFGPESIIKTGGALEGLRIVLCDDTLEESERATVISFFHGIGIEILRISAEEHDRKVAETLFLTHFIGQIISRAGFTRSSIDTVSFGFLMSAVESVKNDRQLFLDVYRFNPFCRTTIERFCVAEKEIQTTLENPVADTKNNE